MYAFVSYPNPNVTPLGNTSGTTEQSKWQATSTEIFALAHAMVVAFLFAVVVAMRIHDNFSFNITEHLF